MQYTSRSVFCISQKLCTYLYLSAQFLTIPISFAEFAKVLLGQCHLQVWVRDVTENNINVCVLFTWTPGTALYGDVPEITIDVLSWDVSGDGGVLVKVVEEEVVEEGELAVEQLGRKV